LLAIAPLNIFSCWMLDWRKVRNSYAQNAAEVTSKTTPLTRKIMLIKVRRMGVDEFFIVTP
jgi:hypothetical protein